MKDRATEVALFRYSLIRQAADPALSKADRGRLVRSLAAEVHPGPGGEPTRVSRETIDRWIRAWRRGGFEALKPPARSTDPRTPASVLELAAELRRENRARTAAHIAELLRVANGWSPSERTIQRHFARLGLARGTGDSAAVAFGRFEAARPNELWVGDALHGPRIEGKAAILFAFLDDHSRAVCGYRWVRAEDTLRAEAALRWGIASRGVPDAVYLDNGSPFVSAQLARALAVLGVRLIHSRPGRPEGRGKIERFFRTVRDQFLVEVNDEVGSMQELNEAFAAWVETVYHARVHSETGETPLGRFGAGGRPRIPTSATLAEAFLWSETRTVTKTATVSLFSNLYEVDAALVGRRVELVFDPFDLTDIEVRFARRPMGKAVPVRIGRHSHPHARPEETSPPTPTGISYLRLIQARQEADWDARISYAGLGRDNHGRDNGQHRDNDDQHDEETR